MCTAITFTAEDMYFGRTLDLSYNYNEQVVITPRNFELKLTNGNVLKSHYAIIGMATLSQNYPLYYDAANEKGLCIAALNYPDNAYYEKPKTKKKEIAAFEIIPYILGKCSTTKQAVKLLKSFIITSADFSKEMPSTPLHWIISDGNLCITAEKDKKGLNIYKNNVGVLTNSPQFPYHLYNLSNYMNLTSKEPTNKICKKVTLSNYTLGLGAYLLPGDMSSASRFVRAAYLLHNSLKEEGEKKNVLRLFKILSSTQVVKGTVLLKNNKYQMTVYTSCINATKGIYYYKTYYGETVNAVSLFKENLDTNTLICYPLVSKENFNFLN